MRGTSKDPSDHQILMKSYWQSIFSYYKVNFNVLRPHGPPLVSDLINLHLLSDLIGFSFLSILCTKLLLFNYFANLIRFLLAFAPSISRNFFNNNSIVISGLI